MMLHEADLRDQELEELAEELWTLQEEGRRSEDDLRRSTQVQPLEPSLSRFLGAGLGRREGAQIVLTDEGRALAERQVRRHRLAEVLFTTVMQVADDRSVNRTACVIEHVLDPATTNSVCAFLGHPRLCPHGKAIPTGPCCHSLTRPEGPLVEPLSRLPPGASARIVHMVPRDPHRLVRLTGLGLVPGAEVHVQQRAPALVVRVGHTTVALEPLVADEVFVRR